MVRRVDLIHQWHETMVVIVKSNCMAHPGFRIVQHRKEMYQTSLPVKILTKISYSAVRGRDAEAEAVQRILNPRRISAIKDFALNGGDFPANVILNWVSQGEIGVNREGQVDIPQSERAAQIIDGQHRVEGLRAAFNEKPSIGDLVIPVLIYKNLKPQECADIFLSINTEQKPVPRSLVYDLYQIASSEFVDEAAVRARDIIHNLNSDENSPYRGFFKFPGEPQRRGGIALSTAVSEIKPIIEKRGDLDQIGVNSLNDQTKILNNFWTAVSELYGSQWTDSQNVFLYAAGFSGGTDFFRKKILNYCNSQQSFEVKTILNALKLPESELLWQKDVKGLGGREAPKIIYEKLDINFKPNQEQAKKALKF
jgi:DNA sulfur modification protein DndB